MRLIHIVGARPNFIKLAPVYEAAKKKGAEQIIVHTGQHYDYEMSEMFFEELGLPEPNITLDITKELFHGGQTGEMLKKIERGLFNYKVEGTIIIVYGDTNSTLAGTLAAKKLHFRVAHVEAGIRSWDNTMPEEINRKVVDEISDYLFCPSEVAKSNLNGKAMNVGDVTYDQFLWAQPRLKSKFETNGDYFLVTIHRENNSSGIRLSKITSALDNLFFDKNKILWFLHPRVIKTLGAKGSGNSFSCYQNPDPVSYLEMLSLIKHAKMVITDSGGIQKEAFWFKTPCITVRNSTEWPETVRSGWNTLVEPDGILGAVEKETEREDIPNPYGDGKAAEKMMEYLAWLQ